MADPAPDIEAGDPRYDGFRITWLYAYTAVDPADNQEGIVDFHGVALIGTDMRRMESLEPAAKAWSRENGNAPVWLKKFGWEEATKL